MSIITLAIITVVALALVSALAYSNRYIKNKTLFIISEFLNDVLTGYMFMTALGMAGIVVYHLSVLFLF